MKVESAILKDQTAAIKKIAVFDSGIGGITFLRDAVKRLPREHFVYFADTENVPYGTKNAEEVKRFVHDAVRFLSTKNLKMLVIACNAATSAAVGELRQMYSFPILGMEPAIKPALHYAAGKRVLLFSTSLTIRGEKLLKLMVKLDPSCLVDTVPFDLLVKTAEAFDFSSPEVQQAIREKLDSIPPADYGAVVLGCTHFIFYRRQIEEMLPAGISVFDGNEGTLNNVLATLGSDNSEMFGPAGAISFYASCKAVRGAKAKRLMELINR
ncbi:MAG TPA: glutamate racemase [Dissulfurispiraceae bacterium]|nr:glutamate racemase [Dissulfurispiraceae bacterium]